MQMVLRNLLSNAIKFCHHGCQITIKAAHDTTGFIKLQVSDDGVGISEENILRIFSGENVSSRGTLNEKGTGIGLMVCWDFMARNEGSIELSSVVDEGTIFNLKIPSADAAPLAEIVA
jgi:signal transduction histidine kinase